MRGAPCKDCADRKLGCHGNCPKYQEFKAYCDLVNEKRLQKNLADQYQLDKALKGKKLWNKRKP